MRVKVTVPPTMEQGSYSMVVSAGGRFSRTVAQEALSDYNSARVHDGLPPLRRMPRGTEYHRIQHRHHWVSDPRVSTGWHDADEKHPHPSAEDIECRHHKAKPR
jgi:hypothetical protein